jgi:hypothetical protein
MNNLMFNISRFMKNKNTVTILGVFLGILILYFGYNMRVRQAIRPERMPYALVIIQPRQLITTEMVGYVDVPPKLIMGKVIRNPNLIIGKYANYNTVIPSGSLFYEDALVELRGLPDSAFINIPDGYIPFNFPVTIDTTYGNSIFPGNYINMYFKALNEDGKIIVGKLIENIEILAVKDKGGRHVFEDTNTERNPSTLIFAVPEEIHLLLRKSLYLGNVAGVRAELIPVPNTIAYHTEPGEIAITNQFLRGFIEINTGFVPEDFLPTGE